MGANWDFIVPPTCVTVRKVGSRRNRQVEIQYFWIKIYLFFTFSFFTLFTEI